MDRQPNATCAQCGELPQQLVANTGRDDYLPEAAARLTSLDLSSGHDLRRCPACGAWFVWQDHPHMYGSGNNWEESLRRLDPEASRELERLLEETDGSGSDAELERVFTTLREVAHLVLGARPRTLERFLEPLVARLCRGNDLADYRLLYGWAGSDTLRRRRLLELLQGHAPLPSYADTMRGYLSRP